jgi:two-component system, cell cycle response regulator DivK
VRKEKILIVEDDPDCREILTLYLKHMGYQTLVAGNGERSIACSLAEHPDLILIDLSLPDMSGLKAASIIKQNPDTSRIPIVAVTAWDTTTIWKEKATKAGITKYLVKPVSPLILKETIEELTYQNGRPENA